MKSALSCSVSSREVKRVPTESNPSVSPDKFGPQYQTSDSEDLVEESFPARPNPLQQLLLPKHPTEIPETRFLQSGAFKDDKSLKNHSSNSLNNWRRSLWPPLSPFYRILLRCKCVRMEQSSSSTSSISQNKKSRRGNSSESSLAQSVPLTSSDISIAQNISLEWTEFWDSSCLERIPTTFDR